MATLFGSFQVGVQALLAHQLSLNVTGNNISNASTEGYSRQRVNLVSSDAIDTTAGLVSTGVRVSTIERIRDEFIDYQIRSATSNKGYLDKNTDIFDQIQTILQDPLNATAELVEENAAESGLTSLLSKFFGAFQDLAVDPESIAVRATVRETAITLANTLNTISESMDGMADQLNEEIDVTVTEINSLLEQIGKLNQEIVRMEADPDNIANDLRDTRDGLLNQLAEYVPISVTEQANGQVDVRVFGSGVVIGNRVSSFEVVSDPEDPSGVNQIINSTERSRVLTSDFDTGKLGALIEARDTLIPGVIKQFDSLAKTIVQEVNRIHSESIGLEAFTSLTSQDPVSDATIAMNNLGLDFPPQAGSFVVRVVDSAGEVQNLYTVNFDPSVDSLQDLAARIDAIDGVAGAGGGSISAAVTTDNRLQITSNGNYEFTFQGDTSNVLAAIGMNTFFSGNDAGTISVSAFISDSDEGLRRIAASISGASGDNAAALAMADLRDGNVAAGGATTIGDYYLSIISTLGVKAERNATESETTDSTLKALETQLESVTGVSLDEEAVNLIKFQQAFNAASRYITTVDSLVDRVINGMGASV
jgi:flagellar hook-associated protein 1